MHRSFFCLATLFATSLFAAETKTLRSFGAVGDGETDDRAAIERAIAQSDGAPLDGEGATYAVRGNIEVRVPIDLRAATFRQTLGAVEVSRFFPSVKGAQPPQVQPPEELRGVKQGLPWLGAKGVATYAEDPVLTGADLTAVRASIALRTLLIRGAEGKLIAVKLEKVRILRGHHPETGGRTDGAGIMVEYASPVKLSDVEITGDGKGMGLQIKSCRQVRLERLNIHDMRWALYPGDIMPTAASLKADWGWNNNPIYEFRAGLNRFVRVRVQEQLVGLFIVMCEDVEVVDSTIARLGTEIAGRFFPWQADGMTINSNKNLTIRRCQISDVWEGIDFTGQGGEDFVEEDVTTTDTFSYGFKFAHGKKNGRVTRCTSIRAGMTGFLIGSECDNVTFTDCHSLETGAAGYWTTGEVKPSVSGFRIEGVAGSPLPRRVRLENCTAINKEFAGAMAYGFLCEANAAQPEKENVLINPKAEGYQLGPVKGFSAR